MNKAEDMEWGELFVLSGEEGSFQRGEGIWAWKGFLMGVGWEVGVWEVGVHRVGELWEGWCELV